MSLYTPPQQPQGNAIVTFLKIAALIILVEATKIVLVNHHIL